MGSRSASGSYRSSGSKNQSQRAIACQSEATTSNGRTKPRNRSVQPRSLQVSASIESGHSAARGLMNAFGLQAGARVTGRAGLVAVRASKLSKSGLLPGHIKLSSKL